MNYDSTHTAHFSPQAQAWIIERLTGVTGSPYPFPGCEWRPVRFNKLYPRVARDKEDAAGNLDRLEVDCDFFLDEQKVGALTVEVKATTLLDAAAPDLQALQDTLVTGVPTAECTRVFAYMLENRGQIGVTRERLQQLVDALTRKEQVQRRTWFRRQVQGEQ